MKRLTVAIAGSYLGHGGNLGDEANHQGISQAIKRLGYDARIVVLSRVPQHDLFGPLYSLQEITDDFLIWFDKEVDLLIASGGDIIEPGPLSVQALLKPLEKTNVPIVWFSAGAQWSLPYSDEERLSIIESLKRASYISVRNRASKQFLDSLRSGVTVDVLPDAVVLVDREPSFAELKAPGLIAFNLRAAWSDDRVLNALASLADRLIEEENAAIIFLPFSWLRYEVDATIFHKFRDKCRNVERVFIYLNPETPGRMLSLLENFSFVLTSRLHGLVFAQMANRPFAAIDCHPKMCAYLNENGFLKNTIVDTSQAVLASQGYGYDVGSVRIDADFALARIRELRSEPPPAMDPQWRVTLEETLDQILRFSR